jgi:MoxR-like ATPase
MVRMEDIAAVAEPVLRHRVITTFSAQADGISSIDVTNRLLEELRKAG